MKRNTLSFKLEFILANGSIKQSNNFYDVTPDEKQQLEYIDKGFRFYEFEANNNNLDCVKFCQWTKTSKQFIENVYNFIK
jgi:hypothetical protein